MVVANLEARPKCRVLAVASAGGHWEQLMLLRPVLDRFETHYALTNLALAERDGVASSFLLPDANRNNRLAAISCNIAAFRLIRRLQPDAVITSGALPGLIVLFWARFFGARTIWIDSVANSRALSMSGRWARHVASLWLTQWQHLATSRGPRFEGRLL